MSLTLEEVQHIAQLARLNLSPQEMERYRQQLSAILEYATRLQELDTSHIPPTASVLPSTLHSALRADETAVSLELKQLLSNAPQSEENQFRVPPVFEDEP